MHFWNIILCKYCHLDGPQFNVKIFIGVEYECYRGHRFMCSGPDRVLRITNSGHVKVSCKNNNNLIFDIQVFITL